MKSAVEALRETVASLSEAEAAITLEYIGHLRRGMQNRELVNLMRDNPAVRVPEQPFVSLPSVVPVEGVGVPASELLVRNRR